MPVLLTPSLRLKLNANVVYFTYFMNDASLKRVYVVSD